MFLFVLFYGLRGMTEVIIDTTDPRYHRPPDGSRWYGGSVVQISTNYYVEAVSYTDVSSKEAEVGGGGSIFL